LFIFQARLTSNDNGRHRCSSAIGFGLALSGYVEPQKSSCKRTSLPGTQGKGDILGAARLTGWAIVSSWPLTDISMGSAVVLLRANSGHWSNLAKCLLMTQSGHGLI